MNYILFPDTITHVTEWATTATEFGFLRHTVSSLSRVKDFPVYSYNVLVLALDVYDAKTNESKDRFKD